MRTTFIKKLQKVLFILVAILNSLIPCINYANQQNKIPIELVIAVNFISSCLTFLIFQLKNLDELYSELISRFDTISNYSTINTGRTNEPIQSINIQAPPTVQTTKAEPIKVEEREKEEKYDEREMKQTAVYYNTRLNKIIHIVPETPRTTTTTTNKV